MKKGFSKKIIKVFACFCTVAMLSGCGMKSATDRVITNATMVESCDEEYPERVAFDQAYNKADGNLWTQNSLDDSASGETASMQNSYGNTSASKRKLIKNVSMKLETQEYDQLMGNLDRRVKELGGYVQNMDSYNGSTYNDYGKFDSDRYGVSRYANLVLRIPQDKLDEFIQSVSELAYVINRKEGVEDVTLQYVDVKSHKESLQVEQERILALLERAETLEDIITLESRLSSIRYQIESMESTLRTYDDLVDYSTVSLRIDEVKEYTPVVEEVVEETKFEKMINGFMNSLENIKNGAIDLGISFVINLPYLVIWAVVILVIVLVIKKIRKSKKEKLERVRAIMEDAVDAKVKLDEEDSIIKPVKSNK